MHASHAVALRSKLIMETRNLVKRSRPSGPHHQSLSLMLAVNMFCGQECLRRHDKVFALLSLTGLNGLPVDYRMSLYELLARSLLANEMEHSLAYLSWVTDENKDPSENPHRPRTFHITLYAALAINPQDPKALLIEYLLHTRDEAETNRDMHACGRRRGQPNG
jgi:hypothetical protein